MFNPEQFLDELRQFVDPDAELLAPAETQTHGTALQRIRVKEPSVATLLNTHDFGPVTLETAQVQRPRKAPVPEEGCTTAPLEQVLPHAPTHMHRPSKLLHAPLHSNECPYILN